MTEALRRIYIVPYSHNDWAWMLHRRFHEKRYALILEEVLDILQEHPEFRWYIDTYGIYLAPFLRRCPERVPELRRRVHEGKIAICGTFSNIRPSMVGGETFIRDMTLGRKRFRKLFPRADLSVHGHVIDVMPGHPQLPQLLRLAGYRYFSLMRPYAALSEKGIPFEFFWQGLDGSRVLCCREKTVGFMQTTVCELEKELKKMLEEGRPFSRSGIRWIGTGDDDCRPLRVSLVDAPIPMFEFLRAWNASEKVPASLATPVEYFKDLETVKDKLPIVKGTLDPREGALNVGWGGEHGLFHLRQMNDQALVERETWEALETLDSGVEPKGGLDEDWEQHLVSCAHASQWLFESDFEELYRRSEAVKLRSWSATDRALRKMADRVATGQGAEFVMFNSMAFERRTKARAAMSFEVGAPDRFALVDGRGRSVPYQVEATNVKGGRKWECWVTADVTLPALGHTTLSVAPGSRPARSKACAFEARFDGPDIVEVRYGGLRYRTRAGNGFGRMRLHHVDTTTERYHVGPITSVEHVRWENTRRVDDGGLYQRYLSEGTAGGHRLRRETIVYRDEPRIEFRIELFWGPEDGFLTLEWPRLPRGVVHGAIPFGVELKDVERERYVAGDLERGRQNLFFATSFVSCSDGDKGISYVNNDATWNYVLFDDSVGNIIMNSVSYRPGWEAFVNRRAAGEGQHRFAAHLVFHNGDWKKAHVPRLAASLLHPATVYPVEDRRSGNLPPCLSRLEIGPANLALSAVYREGRDTVVRFYETEGRPATARLRLPRIFGQVKITDFEGHCLKSLPPGDQVRLRVRPWQIVTLRLSDAGKGRPS